MTGESVLGMTWEGLAERTEERVAETTGERAAYSSIVTAPSGQPPERKRSTAGK
jgi:hypothetical protein